MTNPSLHSTDKSEQLKAAFVIVDQQRKIHQRGNEITKDLQRCMVESQQLFDESTAKYDARLAAEAAKTLPEAKTQTLPNDKSAANEPSAEPVEMAMTRDAVLSLVSTGKIFSVTFTKRTTGETRAMQARTGVTRHLKGGQKSFSDVSKNLLTVWSMDSHGYRSIPIDAIRELQVCGTRYVAA